MQMRRRAAGIAGVTDVAHDVARHHEISGLQITEPVQVCIVMSLPAGTEDPNHIAADTVLADSQDETASRGADRCSLRREDIDPLMPTSTIASSSPRVAKRVWRNTHHGNRQSFWWVVKGQTQGNDRMFEWPAPNQQS